MSVIDVSGLSRRRAALLGNPNCGKTALFNRLTGSHQKVGNYAGVTVELKRGLVKTPLGKRMTLVDLPGTYDLVAASDDEAVACDVISGASLREPKPDLVVCVLDATRLRRGLRLLAGLRAQAVPVVVVVNMLDRLPNAGELDLPQLQAALGVPVRGTVGTKGDGMDALLQTLDDDSVWAGTLADAPNSNMALSVDAQALAWLQAAGVAVQTHHHVWTQRLDAWALNPVSGSLTLLALLFVMFQAVFAWAEAPMGFIEDGTAWVGELVTSVLPSGLLQSLLVDGIVAGVGGVLVFLPQIVVLFLFILVLEESGYLPRAALMLDGLMGRVGLSGRSFIPLLSSFACAIPGILASRTVSNPRDRWVTIMIAPLMTCSARLPVYALLIGAFVPASSVSVLGLSVNVQGLVLLGLYLLGIVSAVAVALVLKWQGQWAARKTGQHRYSSALMMELPDYHWPDPRSIAIGLWQRASIFLRNVGGIILSLTIILWVLATFPSPPEGFTGAAIEYSLAGRIGHALAVVFEPIGFNWQIAIALIPGLAAREVAVGALATVYALSQTPDVQGALSTVIAQTWGLPTALSLLIWYVYAPQCLATLATVKRELGGWRAPSIMAMYMFGLAYAASWVTYRLALAW
ncbi:ferrous iron transporter B [Comamonadaceae bacterium M7527]|nr:ferrous iron transporter B [Comamonadaceae bacterium M7527]